MQLPVALLSLSLKNKKKFNLKKFPIFSRKAFPIFREKGTLIFWEMELSSSKIKNFLYFQK